MFSRIHKLARRLLASSRVAKPSTNRRLSVELLEDRVLLATRIWDGGIDGSGIAFTDAHWSSPQNWVGDIAPVAGDDLQFPVTALQTTAHNDFAPGTTFRSISISGSDYVLTGSGVTLSAGIRTTNINGGNTIALPITLSSSQTFTSGVEGTNLLLTSPALDNGGHTWTVAGAGDVQFSGATITGSGGLTKNGTGQLILANSTPNSYRGTTTVNAGTLLLWASGGNAVPGSLSVGSGIQGTNSAVVRLSAAEQIGDASAVQINGTGLLDLNGYIETVGPLTLQAGEVTTGTGVLVLGGDVTALAAAKASKISGQLSLGKATSRIFTVANGTALADLDIEAKVSGAAGLQLVKQGEGRMHLRKNNTYAGETWVDQGTLWIHRPRALGATTAGTVVATGASLVVESPGAATEYAAEPLVLNGNGDVHLADGGALLALGAHTSPAWSGPITLASSSAIAVNDGVALNLTGTINGPGDLIKLGEGMLRLSAANSYTGATAIRAGVLAAANAHALGATGPMAGTTVTAAGALQLEGDSIFAPESLTLRTLGGTTAALHNVGTNTWTGPIQLAATSQINATSGGTLTVSGEVRGPAGSGLVIGRSSAAGDDGVVLLTAANTYAGPTRVNVGTLAIRNATALGSPTDTANPGTTVNDGATLQLRGGITFDPTESLTLNGSGRADVGALHNRSGDNTWTAPITLATGAAIGANNDSTLTITGVVGGSSGSALTKVGEGTVVLDAANLYSGATTVTAGTLAVQQVSALGATTAGTTVRNGATLELRGGVAFAAEPLKLNGAGIDGAAGAFLSADGNNTWKGTITLGRATTVGAAAGSQLTLAAAIANEGYLLTVNAVGDVNCSRTISGSGGLTKVGGGTLTFSGASPNTYAGATKVNAGTLRLARWSEVVAVSGSGLSINGGVLEGSGIIGTSVTNAGVVRPNGTLKIQGDYTQTSTGHLDVQLGGRAEGQFSRLAISGRAKLNGTLNVTRVNGYVPSVHDVWSILTFGSSVGNFATVNTNGMVLDLIFAAGDLSLAIR